MKHKQGNNYDEKIMSRVKIVTNITFCNSLQYTTEDASRFVVEMISSSVVDKIGYGTSGGGFQHSPFPNYGFSEGGHSNYGYEYHSSGGKKSVALSALTLLAFLFFLHILQSCVQEHINSMNTQVVVMATRESVGVKSHPNRQHKGEIEIETVEDHEDEVVWDRIEGREFNGNVRKLKAEVKVVNDQGEI